MAANPYQQVLEQVLGTPATGAWVSPYSGEINFPLPTKPNSLLCKAGNHDIRDHHGNELPEFWIGDTHPTSKEIYSCKRCGKRYKHGEVFRGC